MPSFCVSRPFSFFPRHLSPSSFLITFYTIFIGTHDFRDVFVCLFYPCSVRIYPKNLQIKIQYIYKVIVYLSNIRAFNNGAIALIEMERNSTIRALEK